MTKALSARFCVALVGALLAAGCGIKGAPPDLTSDQSDMFPGVYPQGAVPPEPAPRSIFAPRRPDVFSGRSAATQ